MKHINSLSNPIHNEFGGNGREAEKSDWELNGSYMMEGQFVKGN